MTLKNAISKLFTMNGVIISHIETMSCISKTQLKTVNAKCRLAVLIAFLPLSSSTVATLKRQISSVPQEFMLE